MGASSIQQAIEALEQLPLEEQQIVVELLQRRIAETRRAEIARNARTTLRAVRAGRASSGTVDDLRRELGHSE